MVGSDLFIEASAGTGKTYTIEQHVKRLICEEGLTLDQILIVTFTNAATFELKERIRKLLAKEGVVHLGEESIFTIHGFCQKALKDYAFETNFPFDIAQAAPDCLKRIAKDVLQGELSFLHPKQLEKLLGLHRQDSDALTAHLARLVSCRVPIKTGPTYAECHDQITALLQDKKPHLFLEDLLTLATCYGKFCNRSRDIKPEMTSGLTSLSQGNWIDSPILLFSPDNRLKRKELPTLHYPGLVEAIYAIAYVALQPLNILALVAAKVSEKAEKEIKENEWIFFEDLILSMRENLHNDAFVSAIRETYKVVIIDEFQDTDRDQWEIFSTLFLNHSPLYLVGDPKQAIYRFRRADIYTYLDAKQQMKNCQTLDTNYRSSPTLVEGLNQLFEHLRFPLPKTNDALLYEPVKAGKETSALEPPIVKLEAETEQELFDKVIVAIQAHPEMSAAVLVKDRHQAERFKACCPLPVRLRRTRSLLASPALSTLETLLRVIVYPGDTAASDLLLSGRFSHCTPQQLWQWHAIYNEKGILNCMVHLLETCGAELFHQVAGMQIYHDLLHFAEILEEREEEELLEAFDAMVQEDPEQEGLKGRQLSEGHAIEVMTTHVSKGLEFDLVFPVGLALAHSNRRDLVFANGMLTSDDAAWEAHAKELDAERVRQLYVACTRPKHRLYLPVIHTITSPLSQLIEQQTLPTLVEKPLQEEKKLYKLTPPLNKSFNYSREPIFSFSSLVQTAHVPKETKGDFPSGPEVGNLLHKILEKISFQSKVTERAVGNFLKGSLLEEFVTPVAKMLEEVRTTLLPSGFTLEDVDPAKMRRELSFLYPKEGGYCKGFIDLLFEHQNKFYIIDWKSNLIEGTIANEVAHHQYDLQAKLYFEAIKKLIGINVKLNVFFFFLRNGKEGVIDLTSL